MQIYLWWILNAPNSFFYVSLVSLLLYRPTASPPFCLCLLSPRLDFGTSKSFDLGQRMAFTNLFFVFSNLFMHKLYLFFFSIFFGQIYYLPACFSFDLFRDLIFFSFSWRRSLVNHLNFHYFVEINLNFRNSDWVQNVK